MHLSVNACSWKSRSKSTGGQTPTSLVHSSSVGISLLFIVQGVWEGLMKTVTVSLGGQVLFSKTQPRKAVGVIWEEEILHSEMGLIIMGTQHFC